MSKDNRRTPGLVALLILAGGAIFLSVSRAPRQAALPTGRPHRHPPLEFPLEALARTNPLPDSRAVRARGRALFVEGCADCHGKTGAGDGPQAVRLSPRPADLRKSGVIPGHSDAWLFYRITKGKLGTAMPGFEPTYEAPDRWAIVRYLRQLDPD